MEGIEHILMPDTPFNIEGCVVLAAKIGSESHGTYIPNTNPDSIDDRDVQMIVIPPKEYYLGLKKWEGADSIKGEWDVVMYEFRKFVGLLMKQNPNVLGTLWQDEGDYMLYNSIAKKLRDNRTLFQNKKMAHDAFIGYAKSQLYKMETGVFKGYMGAKRKYLVEKFGYDCYLDNETEFLTNKGWKRFDEVDIKSDFLGTVVPVSGEFEYQKAVNKTDHVYNGKMYILEPYMSRAVVTPNHSLLLSAAHRSKKNNFSIKYEEEKSAWRLLNLNSVLEGRRSHFHFRRAAVCKRKDFTLVSDNFLKLLGMFISEGTVQFRGKNSKGFKCIRITQKTGLQFKNEMAALEKVYNIKRYDYEKETVWLMHGLVAKNIYEVVGHSHQKHLPSWVYYLSYRQVVLLWDFMMLGDGTRYHYGDVYHTANKKLASDVQAMLTVVGILCSVNGPYRNETAYGVADMYQIYNPKGSSAVKCINLGRISKTNKVANYKKGCALKEVGVSDKRVVCFEVPNSTLITRSSGKVAIHGNCKNGAHLIRLLHMGTEYLETCEMQVRRTWDVDVIKEIKAGEWTLEAVKRYAEVGFTRCHKAYEESSMQEEIDKDKISKLVLEILEERLGLFNVSSGLR